MQMLHLFRNGGSITEKRNNVETCLLRLIVYIRKIQKNFYNFRCNMIKDINEQSKRALNKCEIY